MFGYRLLRDADYATLQADLRAARARVDALLLDLIQATAEARSRTTAYDLQTKELNTLHLRAGQLEHKLTGLPAHVPQVVQGHPLMTDALGAGSDLFEDVGDTRAAELERAGLLHDRQTYEMPAGADLTPQ